MITISKYAAAAPKSVISPENRQFIAYLQSCLRVLDRQSQTVTENKAIPISSYPTAAVPPPPPTNLPANILRAIERIYVPVYPQTPPTLNQGVGTSDDFPVGTVYNKICKNL
ncbi:MAG: hypothetical protein ACKPA9_13970 [Microcystis sp.]